MKKYFTMKTISMCLIFIMISLSFVLTPSKVEATSSYKLLYSRGPRISAIDKTKEDGIYLTLKDDSGINRDSIKVEKYNTTKKEYQTLDNKYCTIKHISKTESSIFIADTAIGQVGTLAKFRIYAKDKTSFECYRYTEFNVQKLETPIEKDSKTSYYKTNFCPSFSLTSETASSIKKLINDTKTNITMKDKNGLKSLDIHDYNTGNTKLSSKTHIWTWKNNTTKLYDDCYILLNTSSLTSSKDKKGNALNKFKIRIKLVDKTGLTHIETVGMTVKSI